MHSSSAHLEASSGQMTLIDCPESPHLRKRCCGGKTRSFAPCNWAICCPLVTEAGIGSSASCSNSGLWSNVSRWLIPPAM
jgi:hypothetical protein